MSSIRQKSLGGQTQHTQRPRMTNGPQSNQHSALDHGKRMSLKPAASSRLSLAPSARQSIVSRRQSVYVPGHATSMPTARDNRDINRRDFQQTAIRTIIEYLQSKNYDKPLTIKTLTSPTTKEFRSIITFLLQHIDPNFELSDKSYEEEIRVFFKLVGYPFVLPKTALQSIGSPHTWPLLIAATEWLVISLKVAQDTESTALGPNGSYKKGDYSEFFEPNPNERTVFEYMSAFYNNWMKRKTQDIFLEPDLENAIDVATSQATREVETLRNRIASLETEISIAKDPHAEIAKIENEKNEYTRKLAKIKELASSLEKNEQVWLKELTRKQGSMKEKREMLKQYETEKEFLRQQIAQQDISPVELTEITSQKSVLESSQSNLQSQHESLSKQVDDLHQQIHQKTSVVRSQLEKYIERIQSLGLHTALPLRGEIGNEIRNVLKDSEEENFLVDILPLPRRDSEGFYPIESKNVLTRDIYNEIIPPLTKYRVRVREREWNLESAIITTQNEMHRLQNVKAEKTEKLALAQSRSSKIETVLQEKTNFWNSELKIGLDTIDDIQHQISQLKLERGAAAGSTSDYQTSQLQQMIDDLQIRHSDERERLNVLVCSITDDVAAHINKVNERLKEVEQEAKQIHANISK